MSNILSSLELRKMDKNDYGILHLLRLISLHMYKKVSSVMNAIMCLFLFDVFDGIVFLIINGFVEKQSHTFSVI